LPVSGAAGQAVQEKGFPAVTVQVGTQLVSELPISVCQGHPKMRCGVTDQGLAKLGTGIADKQGRLMFQGISAANRSIVNKC
jgi:hypothetical protein